jgi:hypothetical protein
MLARLPDTEAGVDGRHGLVLAAVVLPLVLGEGWRYRARVDRPAASGADRRTNE